MYLEKTEIAMSTKSSDSEILQTNIDQLSELELSLIGGGMGDVQQ